MLSEKNPFYQELDLHFNILLMSHCKLQAVICGKLSCNSIYLRMFYNDNIPSITDNLSQKLFHRGTFRMERDDGFMFDCRIPPFSLESKQDDPTTNNGDPNGPTIIGN